MLKFESILLLSADLPRESDIPDIKGGNSLPTFKLNENIPNNHGLYIGQGMVPSVLPYKMQSIYGRELKERQFPAAILENEHIRATFLPTLGGRLWSLYDKQLKKELLYKNKAIIFANLALRNAWFAGGVEWNIGVRGHSHFTCSPLFTCREINSDGDEILKMYEYEAIRGLAYVIRAGLYKDTLRINISIENTRHSPTYLYWWSNIAIPQTKETRVFVPTDKSYITTYRNGGYEISYDKIPTINGNDISYPANALVAKDYFFDIPKENKKWIASIENDGTGLLQLSDKTLLGRKLFVWGNTEGGKHWNDWLTDGGEYAEIQAGLAKTQFEHIPMDARQIVSWNECYRSVTVKCKDNDYNEVCKEIDRLAHDCEFGDFFDIKESYEPIIYGSERGTLAKMLEPKEATTICTFPEIKENNKSYFATLINQAPIPKEPGLEYAIDSRYLNLIDKKTQKNDYDHYMGGVIAVNNKMLERAEADFLSVKGKYEYLALACLAQIEVNLKDNIQKGYEYICQAVNLEKNDISLLILYGEISIKAKRYKDFLALSECVSNGRIQMYRAKCFVELGELEKAKAILSSNLVIPDIREGEYSISAIWLKLYHRVIAKEEMRSYKEITEKEVLEKYPIPYKLDFRMH